MCGSVDFGALKGLLRVALPEPTLTVRNKPAEFHHPDTGLDFFNDGGPTSELLPQGNLPTGSDPL
jgi:hypothetical protein